MIVESMEPYLLSFGSAVVALAVLRKAGMPGLAAGDAQPVATEATQVDGNDEANNVSRLTRAEAQSLLAAMTESEVELADRVQAQDVNEAEVIDATAAPVAAEHVSPRRVAGGEAVTPRATLNLFDALDASEEVPGETAENIFDEGIPIGDHGVVGFIEFDRSTDMLRVEYAAQVDATTGEALEPTLSIRYDAKNDVTHLLLDGRDVAMLEGDPQLTDDDVHLVRVA